MTASDRTDQSDRTDRTDQSDRTDRTDQSDRTDRTDPTTGGSFVVACPDCRDRREMTDPNEAVAFFRRHERLTGHDVAWERADLGETPVPDGDLEAVVAQLEAHYDEGVPVGVVAAAMGAQGHSMRETLDGLREIRLSGGLYEPRDDHLRTF